MTDTLVLSRPIRSDLKNDDYNSRRTAEEFPKKYYGSHGLKAWGIAFGILKGDFGEQTDWSEWSQGMQDYCEQDVKVTLKLWEALAHTFSQEAIAFEHRIYEPQPHRFRWVDVRHASCSRTLRPDGSGAVHHQRGTGRCSPTGSSRKSSFRR